MSNLNIKDLTPFTRKRKIKLNERLPSLPFFWCIAAPRGSGKSNLILNLFRKEFYKNIFPPENVILISPSLDMDDMMEKIPADHRFKKYDPEIIQQLIEEQIRIKNEFGKNKMPHILIIFDDNITEDTFKPRGVLETIGFRMRHFNISAIFTTQKYSALSRGIRLNCQQTTFFEPMNNSEIDHILMEHSDRYNRSDFLTMFKYATNDEFSFLHIDYTKPKGKRFQKNFTEYLNIGENI